MTPQEQIDFIRGPQALIGSSWFDQTFVNKARMHGRDFPAVPPPKPVQPVEPQRKDFSDDASHQAAYSKWATDPIIKAWVDASDAYINANYYDQGLAQAIAHKRTGDPEFLAHANKIADSWWLSPHIKEGTVRTFDTFTYTPRNVSLGGLILRAMSGRRDMWDWINAYTRSQFNAWLKSRINNTQLHLGVRDGAFMLHYATWLSQVLPDSFPLQAGGTATNGAALRAQDLADVEAVSINYFARLQYPDGSWRWDDPYSPNEDGGTPKGIMQPFMVGLLLCALCDVHQIVSESAKTIIAGMIFSACRHLYSGGPYSKDLVPHFKVGLRGFHYVVHGGTTVNPTKWEKGDFPFDTTVNWHVSSARQAISTVLPAFGYAYKISGDSFFKAAGDEMFDSAYGGGDGFRAMLDDTAKNLNQHARRAASYLVWSGGVATPAPLPQPEPIPAPTQPAPVLAPSLDGAKAVPPDEFIVDDSGGKWTFGANKAILRNGVQQVGGQGTVLKWTSRVVYTFGLDNQWWRWTGRGWDAVGTTEPGGTVTPPTPVPEPLPPPPPTPVPVPVPTPEEYRIEALAKDTEAARTALYQRMWTVGFAAWAEQSGPKVKFRRFK